LLLRLLRLQQSGGMELRMEELIEVLSEIKDDVEFENVTNLIDGRYLDSLDILQIIAALNDEFDIAIPAAEIVPENFNSAAAMWDMVQRLMDE
jgi:acyl carrier protein